MNRRLNERQLDFLVVVSVVYVCMCVRVWFTTQLLSLNYTPQPSTAYKHRQLCWSGRTNSRPMCQDRVLYMEILKWHKNTPLLLYNRYTTQTYLYDKNASERLHVDHILSHIHITTIYTLLQQKPICSFEEQVTRTAADPVIVFVYRFFFSRFISLTDCVDMSVLCFSCVCARMLKTTKKAWKQRETNSVRSHAQHNAQTVDVYILSVVIFVLLVFIKLYVYIGNIFVFSAILYIYNTYIINIYEIYIYIYTLTRRSI